MMNEIKSTLESLGYKLHDRGAFYHCAAIYRGGDNETAIQVYKDTGCWKDHVLATAFMPFKALVEKTLKTKDPEVIKKYLKGDTGVIVEERRRNNEKLTMEKTYDESVLERLLPHYSFYTKKDISESVLKFFKCGLATNGKMYNRLVFPIFNEYGKINGFAGRHVKWTENISAPKWKLVGKKSGFYYPFYMKDGDNYPTKDAIEKTRRVILIESVGDCISCYNNDVKNIFVTFGVAISPKLICKIMSLDVDEIVIAFNNDDGKEKNVGLESSIKAYLKLLNHFSSDKLKICLPTRNDFGEMEKEDFEDWKNKLDSVDMKKQQAGIITMIRENKIKLPETLRKNMRKI